MKTPCGKKIMQETLIGFDWGFLVVEKAFGKVLLALVEAVS